MLNIIIPETPEEFLRNVMTEEEYAGLPEELRPLWLPSGDTTIQDYAIIPIKDKRFVFLRTDLPHIGDQQIQVLLQLTDIDPDDPTHGPLGCDELHNPVWISIDENGVLVLEG